MLPPQSPPIYYLISRKLILYSHVAMKMKSTLPTARNVFFRGERLHPRNSKKPASCKSAFSLRAFYFDFHLLRKGSSFQVRVKKLWVPSSSILKLYDCFKGEVSPIFSVTLNSQNILQSMELLE